MAKSAAILNWNENLVFDESIKEYEFMEYTPITGTQLNTTGDIRITVESQDIFSHPSESYLLFNGRLTKEDGSAYVNADVVTLTNNGVMHLFDSFRYDLGGKEIETVRYPGQSLTMLKALTVSDDQSKTDGLNEMWVKDTNVNAAITGANENAGFTIRQKWIIQSPQEKGRFQVQIPLKEIFGFAEDYTKVIYGLKQQLTLKRTADTDAIFKNAATDAGKVTLDKISWYLPIVEPNDEEKFALMKEIENKTELSIDYRMRQADNISVPQSTNFDWRLTIKAGAEKPRYILVAFQTKPADDTPDQEWNRSIFNHCNVQSMAVYLNNIQYPRTDYDLNIAQNGFARLFRDVTKFRANYSGLTPELSHCNISPSDWKDLYPFYVFDVSKQSERLKTSTIDVKIKVRFEGNAPANTQAYALVLSDRKILMQSNGNNFNVVY
ncbi:MAG: hypothetical protein MI700_08160 [Balneolales bacterium]|nr:hypothetical protein [Balneolales bacterium]